MKKGITIVFIANVINMLFSVITSFVLPKYLSIESYGYYKVFQLYVNYLGILHLGYVDGIYLRYGGKEIGNINKNEIKESASTLRFAQLLLSTVLLLISIIFRNPIAVFLCLSLLPINMISFYKNLFQATGEFKEYGVVISILPLLLFASDMVLLFVIGTDDYIWYILIAFASNMILAVCLEIRSVKIFGKTRLFSFNVKMLKENIKSGITLTIGNFASIMITSIDRWCIQWLMSISDFSFYSFAVSVENLFNVCVSAITTTLYNYLCKEKNVSRIIRIKKFCSIIGVYLISIAFPVKFIIKHWLIKYDNSIDCLFILICAHSFFFVVKAIYINLYKARSKQKHYLAQMILVLIVATATNLIGYFVITRKIETFAYASLLTAVIWYFICFFEFKDIRDNGFEAFVLILCSIFYLLSGLYINDSIIGFVTYIFFTSFILLIFERDYFFDFIKSTFAFLSKRRLHN